ncbi:MAG: Coenzyme F420 hydrogenase/dehydrogenase, beta subunit C-terminal domain [Promethearchaeota archaeon]|nr:MAG: Coenzyme F420 hydrogenase/dehydrogenase, beta subunit C-terminal domain [Candidatus Lokiarchaeota archaeon]
MVQIANNKLFMGISPKELMEATYNASGNFQIRAFFEAKDEILKAEKYSEEEFYEILDAMIDAETERKLVLEKLRGNEPLFLEEISKIVKEFPPDNVIRDIIYLKEQGYIEEQIEIKTKTVIKKIKGEEKEVEEKEYFYRYQVKDIPDDFIEYFFEPVSLVFESEVCCQCGWCSSVCPVNAIAVTADTLEIDDKICMKCGLCYSVCPRSFSIEQALLSINKLDKSLKFSEKINGYINTYSASTTSDKIKKVRQDGGVVTSLLEYLLKNKLVDAVVAVQHSKDFWKPEPVIVEDVKDLYKTGGTKYANATTLNIIDKTKKFKNIAVVGVPCMMNALEKGTLFPSGLPFFKNIKYRIGLFCMESFPYENVLKLIKEQFDKDYTKITKMDISGGKFIVYLDSGEDLRVPLNDVKSYARHNCHFCEDLTCDCADISVGSIGSPSGWSSVITRTKKGDKLFKDAIKSKLIESQSLKDVKPGQPLLERIAGTKRKNCKPIILEKKND